MSTRPPSLVVCGSVISNPDPAHVACLRSRLVHDPHLESLRREILELPNVWSLLISQLPSLKELDLAPLLHGLGGWITDSNASALPSPGRTSRNTLSAVLTVLTHVLEYISYMDNLELTGCEQVDPHTRALEHLREGGIQGLCIGLLSAAAIACSRNKTELASNAATAIRLALCVGAVVDLDEAGSIEPAMCISARWPRNEGHGSGERNTEDFETLTQSYPEACISVYMDSGSVTITAPKGTAVPLMRHLQKSGALVKKIDVDGCYHHERHQKAFQALASICASLPMLQFSKHDTPLVPLRCNDTGEQVTKDGPVHEMALRCILIKKADWHNTLMSSVKALPHSHTAKLEVLALGPVDCVPRSIMAIAPLQVIRSMRSEAFHHSYPANSIAIIGSSCRFPGSESPQDLWTTILEKKVAKNIESPGSFDCAFFRKSPREAEYMDPQHRLALHLAYEVLESAEYFSPSSTATDNVGCYIGMSSCDYEDHVNARPPTAFSFTGTARAFASGRISHFFGLKGPSMVVDTACSSSGVAIDTACKAVLSGECSMAIAGGINLITAEARSHQNLGAASFLSPSGQCKPFDTSADGYCRGEGGGFVLLKKLSEAVADNDCILGVLASSAVNNSKGTRSITLPSSESQSRLYKRVLDLAGMNPHDVSYVEAHGTGTQKGDPVECESIRAVFGGRPTSSLPPLRFGSIKGIVGHSESASGLASLFKVMLMLKHNIIPPQPNFNTLNPSIPSLEDSRMEIPRVPIPWQGPFRAALVNNYGASGANAAMIVCQSPPARLEQNILANMPRQYPILITAHSATSLQKYCRVLLRFIDDQWNNVSLPNIAFHLARKQNHLLSCRVTFSVRSIEELRDRLRLEVENCNTTGRKPQGGPKPVVLLFSGQTGRRPCLNYEAYESSILLRNHLDLCDRTIQSLGFTSIFPRIFQTDPINDLVDLHCMQFSLQYSAAMSWIDSGLEISMLVGHSLGQLTALCISGVLGLFDALKMISGRALLIQEKWGPEPGRMLSVDAGIDVIQGIAQSMSEKVEIACYNSSSHHVIVGTEAAINIFADHAHSKGVSAKHLPVTHGFHSELFDGILNEFHQLIQTLSLNQPKIPIEACSKSEGSWNNITPELIARQSREPVYFCDAISRIEKKLGSCIWLEAGAGSSGAALARRVFPRNNSPSMSHSFYSTRLYESDPMSSLVDTTLSLWSEQVRVQSWLYHGFHRRYFKALELPPYQFEKTQHWLPFIPRHEKADGPGKGDIKIAQEPPKLVSLLGQTGPDAQLIEFAINQDSKEYSTFIKGRTVLGQTLTPSSVYIEAAARAISLLPGQTSSKQKVDSPIEVGEVKLYAPFGLDLQKQLRLVLQKETGSSWNFTIQTHSINDGKLLKIQATGTIRLQGQAHLFLGPQRPLLRNIYHRCEQLRDDCDASIVQGPFVKKVLGRVANYESSYFGIQSITSKGLEAVGKVVMPSIAPRSCSETVFVPPIFDNILLVSELHVSILGEVSDDDVYICNGFDTVSPTTTSGVPLSKSEGPWLVLSSVDQTDAKVVLSDIFVFHAKTKELVLSILGTRFSRVPMRSLKKALEAVNDGKSSISPSNQYSIGVNDDVNFQECEPSLIKDQDQRVVDIAMEEMPDYFNQGLERHSATSLSRTSSEDSPMVSSEASLTPIGSEISEDHTETAALLSLLADHLDCSLGVLPGTPLGELGLDSLVAIQLQSDVEKAFGQRPYLMINETTTFSDLCSMILNKDIAGKFESVLASTTQLSADEQDQAFVDVAPITGSLTKSQCPTEFITQATAEFSRIKQDTGSFIQQSGFSGFFSEVFPKQMSLVLAYILEAFSILGCDLKTQKEGETLARVQFSPRHQHLMDRLYRILEEARLISFKDGQPIRTNEPVLHTRASADLYHELLAEYPHYSPDHKLLNVTASRLADCLSGRTDPLHILFKDQDSLKLLEDVYISSPLFLTGNKMLGGYIHRVCTQLQQRSHSTKLRILEVGAGTGATTRLVLNELLASGVGFTYTFTDISPALVASSRKRFDALYRHHKPYLDMEFTSFNVEKTPPSNMLHSYDLVISSNCIHATQDLGRSCNNMEQLLRKDGGMICLLELTRPLAWLDCVFGLLDGWWRFDDGRSYALAEEHQWKAVLSNSGFHVDWTDDGSRESHQFRLITAWR